MFYHHPQMPDGRVGKCKDCNRKDVIKNRLKRKKYYDRYDTVRYRTNILRIWKHKYHSMWRRVNGLDKHTRSVGKGIISKSDFLTWCNKNKNTFMKLYKRWEKSGYKRKFAPSIDRINNNLGYEIDNMQWLTQSQNTKKFTK